jgi:hypothetical protein
VWLFCSRRVKANVPALFSFLHFLFQSSDSPLQISQGMANTIRPSDTGDCELFCPIFKLLYPFSQLFRRDDSRSNRAPHFAHLEGDADFMLPRPMEVGA